MVGLSLVLPNPAVRSRACVSVDLCGTRKIVAIVDRKNLVEEVRSGPSRVMSTLPFDDGGHWSTTTWIACASDTRSISTGASAPSIFKRRSTVSS